MHVFDHHMRVMTTAIRCDVPNLVMSRIFSKSTNSSLIWSHIQHEDHKLRKKPNAVLPVAYQLLAITSDISLKFLNCLNDCQHQHHIPIRQLTVTVLHSLKLKFDTIKKLRNKKNVKHMVKLPPLMSSLHMLSYPLLFLGPNRFFD